MIFVFKEEKMNYYIPVICASLMKDPVILDDAMNPFTLYNIRVKLAS